MKFLKHIGKHNDRKVAVVFRQVPDEPHMALVTYTEVLNRHVHDAVINCIESDIGQSSENLADAMNRMHTVDGKLILQLLHHEGLLKKINTELITMTPAPNTYIKLSELNTMLDEMKKGEEAVAKLAEMDKSRGLQDPADVARRMRTNNAPVTQPSNGLLDDNTLAQNLRKQAEKMESEAKGLLAESARLMKEASQLDTSIPVQETVQATKKVTGAMAVQNAPKKAGRPKKSTVVA